MRSYEKLRSMQPRAIVPKAEGITCSPKDRSRRNRITSKPKTKEQNKKAGPLAMRSPAEVASLE